MAFLVPGNVLVLKSILVLIDLLQSPWISVSMVHHLFHPVTFNFLLSLSLRLISYRQYITESGVFTNLIISAFQLGFLDSFTFNDTIDMVRFKSTTLLFVFYFAPSVFILFPPLFQIIFYNSIIYSLAYELQLIANLLAVTLVFFSNTCIN